MKLATAIDGTDDHRMALEMRIVLRDRIDQSSRNHAAWNHIGLRGARLRWLLRIEEQRALFDVPAVVASGDDAVDLFYVVLTYVTHVDVPALPIDGHSKGIAEAVRKNFFDGACAENERVVGGNPIGGVARVTSIDVDAQDLAERQRQVLGIAVRTVSDALIVCFAAITYADVELAVEPEHDVTAVVIELRLVDSYQLAPHANATVGQHSPLGDHRLTVGRRTGRQRARKCWRSGHRLRRKRIEQTVALEIRVKSEAEKAA